MFCKKGDLKNFAEFTGKLLSQSLFLKKLQAQVFSCEFYEIFKNTFFTEHIRATASKHFTLVISLHKKSFFSVNVTKFAILFIFCALFGMKIWIKVFKNGPSERQPLKNLKVFLSRYKIHQWRRSGVFVLNPLSANPTKWSNTLKQFFGKFPTNFVICVIVSYFTKL